MSLIGTFFYAGVFYLAPAHALDCPAPRYDEQVTVSRVYDGDTLRLEDHRKLRLTGINTPEQARDGREAEPYAQAASRYVKQQLWQHKTVHIQISEQSRDRYGRLLAHVFLEDGRNLNALLLKQGLASAIAIPPNLDYAACYFSLEQQARQQHKNLWSHPYYDYRQAETISSETQGFHFVSGILTRIGSSRRSLWLQLAPKFELRINRKDLVYFNQYDFNRYIGHRLTVRGWIYKYNNELRMSLRHPAMVQFD